MKNKTEAPKGEAFYTKTPSVLVIALGKKPMSLFILQYVLLRKSVKQGWDFYINDIAKQMSIHPQTVRKHLKPLVNLKLLSLNGEKGGQHYTFAEEVYAFYLSLNPFEILEPDHSESLVGDHSEKLVGVLLRESRSLKIKEEEMKEKETKEGKTAPADSSVPDIQNPNPQAVADGRDTPAANTTAAGTDPTDKNGLSSLQGADRPKSSGRPESGNTVATVPTDTRKTINGRPMSDYQRLVGAGREYTRRLTQKVRF